MRFDTPIQTAEADWLERGSAARAIVREVYRSLIAAESATIGLVAPWGWGKTSFLALMERAVGELESVPSIPPPVVLWFHPWWYAGRGDLYTEFFLEICEQAKRKLRMVEAKEQWGRALEGFLTLFTCGTTAPLTGALTKEHVRQVAEARSLSALKDKAAKELAKADRQVWIFVDDLDRLDPNAVIHFFGLIRSMADLPWVRYFVPYDRASLHDLVRDAIFCGPREALDEDRVRAYVDKFIQVEIELTVLVDGVPSIATRSASVNVADEGSTEDARDDQLPRSVRQFAIEGYRQVQFDRPTDRIAWIRTFLEATRREGERISTPRDYVRRYTARCFLEVFAPAVLEEDIAMITQEVRAGARLDELLRAEPVMLGKAIFEALKTTAKREIEARQLAREFLGSWAARVRVVGPESVETDKILDDMTREPES